MILSKHNHPKLILIAILALTACTTTSPVVHPSATAKTTLSSTSEQNTERLNQMQTQLQIMQAQIDELQNQLNKIQKQQTTLSRYLNIHIPVTRTTPIVPNKTTNIAEARRLYNAGLYIQSIHLLKNAESGGNGSPIAQERMVLLLQNHARLNNCESVINIGKRFNSLYPQNNQNPNIMYMIAQCQNQMQQQDIARVTCKRIINTYPNSIAATKARQLLIKMK